MLPTPSTSHVCFDHVYEPAEDSYLLLDTLSSRTEAAFLQDRFKSSSDPRSYAPLVLEIGTGSGVVLAFIAANAGRIFGREDILTLGTDINSFACRAASKTVQTAITGSENPTLSPCFLDVVNSDLASSLRPRSVDVLVFNPPYVPTPELPNRALHDGYNALPAGKTRTSFEQDSYLLELSYAGGLDGMETTDRLLDELPNILHPTRGVAYILLCAQNKPEVVKQRIRDWGSSWKAETVGSSGKQGGWEKLQIMKVSRNESLP